MLQIAANLLEQEANEIAAAKEAHLAEKCPTPDLSGDQAALMVRNKKKQTRKDSHYERKLRPQIREMYGNFCLWKILVVCLFVFLKSELLLELLENTVKLFMCGLNCLP